ncbi:hypothetical protein Pmar_PMAR008366, partial [Perkinsus marinus ATCC 50983]
MASATARQTMRYREDAREEIRKYFNCTAEDSVIFCGAGATAAIDRFIGIMCRSRIFATDASPKGLRRAVLIVDPAAHHSSLLPFRELASNYPLIRPASTGQIHAKVIMNHPLLALVPFLMCFKGNESADFEVELETLPLCPVKGTASVEGLEKALKKVMDYNRHHHNSAIPVVVLSACSNICGARLDIPTVSTLIHEYNGVVAWDLAAIAAHDK